MAETRKAIHAFLTPASHEAWHDFAAENGVSVSAMIEAMAVDWRERRDGDDLRAARARRAGSGRAPHRRAATTTGAVLTIPSDTGSDAGRDGGRDDEPDVTPPKRWAAGLPGVAVSGRDALRQMGVVRTVRTLLRVNQRDGFDCPGCAWPEPDHRSPFEFCENGAKAVAEEATTARVDRGVLRRALRRRSCASAVGPLARPAGPADRADVAAARRATTTSRSRGTPPSG